MWLNILTNRAACFYFNTLFSSPFYIFLTSNSLLENTFERAMIDYAVGKESKAEGGGRGLGKPRSLQSLVNMNLAASFFAEVPQVASLFLLPW
jgi:hypothetical protein